MLSKWNKGLLSGWYIPSHISLSESVYVRGFILDRHRFTMGQWYYGGWYIGIHNVTLTGFGVTRYSLCIGSCPHSDFLVHATPWAYRIDAFFRLSSSSIHPYIHGRRCEESKLCHYLLV